MRAFPINPFVPATPRSCEILINAVANTRLTKKEKRKQEKKKEKEFQRHDERSPPVTSLTDFSSDCRVPRAIDSNRGCSRVLYFTAMGNRIALDYATPLWNSSSLVGNHVLERVEGRNSQDGVITDSLMKINLAVHNMWWNNYYSPIGHTWRAVRTIPIEQMRQRFEKDSPILFKLYVSISKATNC